MTAVLWQEWLGLVDNQGHNVITQYPPSNVQLCRDGGGGGGYGAWIASPPCLKLNWIRRVLCSLIRNRFNEGSVVCVCVYVYVWRERQQRLLYEIIHRIKIKITNYSVCSCSVNLSLSGTPIVSEMQKCTTGL